MARPYLSRSTRSRSVLQNCHYRITLFAMKTLTVRLPEALVAEIEAESRERRRSKSDVVRERLSHVAGARARRGSPAIADLVGSVDGLPADLSGQKKAYLKTTGYGRKRAR
jgi:Arc/MetJ-type ribon-helix-helix transcriptional regulator